MKTYIRCYTDQRMKLGTGVLLKGGGLLELKPTLQRWETEAAWRADWVRRHPMCIFEFEDVPDAYDRPQKDLSHETADQRRVRAYYDEFGLPDTLRIAPDGTVLRIGRSPLLVEFEEGLLAPVCFHRASGRILVASEPIQPERARTCATLSETELTATGRFFLKPDGFRIAPFTLATVDDRPPPTTTSQTRIVYVLFHEVADLSYFERVKAVTEELEAAGYFVRHLNAAAAKRMRLRNFQRYGETPYEVVSVNVGTPTVRFQTHATLARTVGEWIAAQP